MNFKRLLALLLALVMVVSLLPAVYAGAEATAEADIWAQITALEDAALAKRGTRAKASPAVEDFAAISEDVERLVVQSGDCIPGSVIRHGSFFYWTAADGEVCGYSPRLRAKMRAATVNPDADPEALSGVETASCSVKGGGPGSADVAVFQPYRGLDSSFTNQYPEEGERIAEALGGTAATYKTTAATVDQVALALEDCAVVLLDSHGDTDYINPSKTDDYVTRANTSYFCMQTNAGWTAADKAIAQGPYGTYYHAYNGGSYGSMKYYCVDGTVLANHMQKPACNNLLWMALCLCMATDGMYKPLHENGVEVVYGYSQSVSFDGDYEYEEYFWNHMLEGHTVGEAFAYMKEQSACNWDPAYSSYGTLGRARYYFAAFPNVVSTEDEYQGHRTVNPKSAFDPDANTDNDPAYGACNVQTVNSAWSLFRNFNLTAVSNNEDWGTVSVVDSSITASPSEGYYAAGYEVLSGSAAVVQNGNVFAVTAEDDCTVQIIFAAKTPATLSFVTPNGVTCDPVSTYVGDEIALPAPAGEPTAAAHSYRFLGWSEQPVEATADAPVYLAAGDAWTVDAEEAVLYALYAYSDTETAVFTRVDEEPADWSGEYVITGSSEVVLDAGGEYTDKQIGSSDAAIPLELTGMTLDGNLLQGVSDAYIYVIEPSTVVTQAYTIRMKGSENYIALKPGSSLLTSDSATHYTAQWLLEWSDGALIRHIISSMYCLQYDTALSAFTCADVSLNNLTLFHGFGGTTYYTTELVCKHDYVAVVTAPTCTEGGYTTHTCSICGDSYTDDCVDALGHDWNEPEYVWAEDCSEITVTRACKNDESHVETEKGAVTSEVTREATINAEGEIVYTATFTNPAFETQTAKVALPKLDDGLPCDGGETCPGVIFTDMPAKDNWAHDAIDWAVVHGVTAGTSATTFSPNAGCTRAQVVTFLYRAAGEPAPKSAGNPFTDVSKDAYYYNAVLWAVEQEITAGTSATTFSPETTCTRAQIVTFLWRYAGAPAPTTAKNPFTDVPSGAYYESAVLWASESNVTAGTSATTFSPEATCTRAHVVTFLYRDIVK